MQPAWKFDCRLITVLLTCGHSVQNSILPYSCSPPKPAEPSPGLEPTQNMESLSNSSASGFGSDVTGLCCPFQSAFGITDSVGSRWQCGAARNDPGFLDSLNKRSCLNAALIVDVRPRQRPPFSLVRGSLPPNNV